MSKQIICKNCGMPFTLTEKQVESYTKQGWSTPKNCSCCRKENRQERASQYYGLYEAIANYTPCKKRRQRVHYKPHLVGGVR